MATNAKHGAPEQGGGWQGRAERARAQKIAASVLIGPGAGFATVEHGGRSCVLGGGAGEGRPLGRGGGLSPKETLSVHSAR